MLYEVITARYGGEEFIVLAPGLTRDGALQFAERFRTVFLAHPFPHKVSQPNGTVSFSGGIPRAASSNQSTGTAVRA